MGYRRAVDDGALVKVWFCLEQDSLRPGETETLWASASGVDEYRLENSPFYAFDVSFLDIVEARTTSDGALTFCRVVRRSGHSTYRILPKANRDSDVEKHWADLQALGCNYEQGANGLRSVDVPPSCDIGAAFAILQAAQDDGVWVFDEGHCGHPLPQKPAV